MRAYGLADAPIQTCLSYVAGSSRVSNYSACYLNIGVYYIKFPGGAILFNYSWNAKSVAGRSRLSLILQDRIENSSVESFLSASWRTTLLSICSSFYSSSLCSLRFSLCSTYSVSWEPLKWIAGNLMTRFCFHTVPGFSFTCLNKTGRWRAWNVFSCN